MRAAWIAVSTAALVTVAGPVQAEPVRLSECGSGPAAPESTNLRAGTITAEEPAGGRYDVAPEAGRMTLLHAMRLTLPDGRLGAGDGFTAESAPEETFPVLKGAATADVTVARIDYEGGDSRIAFVELRFGPTRPVRWEDAPDLSIDTDGGTGGFFSSLAKENIKSEGDSSFDPRFENRDLYCLLRRSESNREPDGILFQTGIGDGGYPTVLGRDGEGDVVSVVHYGMLVPWALSGLPGTPPAEVTAESERRLLTPDPVLPEQAIAPDQVARPAPPAPTENAFRRLVRENWALLALGLLVAAAGGLSLWQGRSGRRAGASPDRW